MPKLWVTHQALCLRREKPEWFGAGAAYTPLDVEGAKKEHLVAYLRGGSVATLVPRCTVRPGFQLGGNHGRPATGPLEECTYRGVTQWAAAARADCAATLPGCAPDQGGRLANAPI